MTATRNPHYWRKGYPYLNSITYKPIINDDSHTDTLETGEIDMMHSNSPDNLLQFRGDTKWSYYDNSGQIVGQPTVQCIMLNTNAEPFNNHTLRTAMAMCINQAQFTKVIDKGIDAPMNGLFLPGSEYYTKTAYPRYNPTQAAKLVKEVKQQTGKSVSFSLASTSDPETLQAAQFLQQAFQTAGMQVNINIIAQATIINNALAGTYQATLWRQFGAVDPDLNYVWWSTTTVGPPPPLNMARNSDPRIQTALQAGRITNEKADRSRRTNRSTSTWPRTSPTCGWPVTRGASSPTPRSRTSPTPRRSRARRRSRTTRACSGRRRSGCPQPGEAARAEELTHLDVVEVLVPPVRVALLRESQAVGRPQGFDEGALVADRHDRAGPVPNMAPTAAMDGGSKLFVGSSSRSRFASPAESMASPSLARSPPERVAGDWSAAFDGRPNDPRSARRSFSAFRTASLTLASAERVGSICSCSWAKYPSSTLCPSSITPLLGSCTPARQRSSDDFPAPLRPMTTMWSPRPAWKVISESTSLVP